MTLEEAEIQRIQLQILATRARAASREFYVDGETFALSKISHKCEAYFSENYQKTGELECLGSELRPIERYCETTMFSDFYGDIDC